MYHQMHKDILGGVVSNPDFGLPPTPTPAKNLIITFRKR